MDRPAMQLAVQPPEPPPTPLELNGGAVATGGLNLPPAPAPKGTAEGTAAQSSWHRSRHQQMSAALKIAHHDEESVSQLPIMWSKRRRHPRKIS